MKNLHIKHFWYVFAAYGVWFAIFSGLEELGNGKYWKLITSLVLGSAVYWVIESYQKK